MPLPTEDDLRAYHVVLTTHNSRTSRRMIRLRIKKGPPIELNLAQEIALARIMGGIIRESGFRCLAYNVCKDHVHLILVCTRPALTRQVQKLKAVSSRLIKPHLPPMEPVPLGGGVGTHRKGKKRYTPFWSQKFFRADMDIWELATLCKKPGYIYCSSYLANAMHYIRYNREKHQLPASEELQRIIDGFIMDQDVAFGVPEAG